MYVNTAGRRPVDDYRLVELGAPALTGGVRSIVCHYIPFPEKWLPWNEEGLLMNGMTIIGVTCVKNEEDIIEAFVRHNLFYLDKLIVLDNGSSDKTFGILSRLVAEGLQVVVDRDLSLGKFQGEKMTRLMRAAVNTHGADWVLLLDADELIRCSQDKLNLPAPGDHSGYLKVAWRTFQARPDDDVSVINPVERIRHRLAEEPCEREELVRRNHLLKAIVPRQLAVATGACVSQGNHLILMSNEESPHAFWSGFEYAHFSLRSPGQYGSKIAISSLQQSYLSSARGGNSSFYLTHLEDLKADFERFSQRFYQWIPSYMESTPGFTASIIHDPLNYKGGPLRYTSTGGDYSRLVANLIGYAEVLVKEAASNAAFAPTVAMQVEETARVDFYGKETDGVLTQTIFANSGILQTVRFALNSRTPLAAANVRIGCLSAIVEIVKFRWIWDDSQPGLVLSGKSLRDQAFIARDAFPIQHEQYLSFVKGNGNTVIGLAVPNAHEGQVPSAIEIEILVETDPTRIGVRLLQSNVIGEMLANAEPIEQLESRVTQLSRKLTQRTTLGGAFGFQIYRLWRAANDLIKRPV